MSRAAPPSPESSPGGRSSSQSRFSRRPSVTGPFLVNPTLETGWSGPCRRWVIRPHTTSPPKHRSSSIEGSYPATRAFSRWGSHAPAAASNPCSCSMASTSPDSPLNILSGSTCCQRSRNRMNTDSETGSISRLSLDIVARLIRARIRLSQYSSSMAPGRNRPLNTCPSPSSRVRADFTTPSGNANASEISGPVCGPETSVLPLTSRVAASSGSESGSCKKRSGGLGCSFASGYAAITSPTDSTATQARVPSPL